MERVAQGPVTNVRPENDVRLTLVLGGARSGKSRYAEGLITALPPPWPYVATAQACDAEMAERIGAHRRRRAAGWQNVEAPHDLPTALDAHRGRRRC